MAEVMVFAAHRDGTGKSTVAANAAWLAARRGLRVGVVDADLWSPGLHATLGLGTEAPGKSLNDVIEGQASLSEAVREIALPAEAAAGRGKLVFLPASADVDRLLKTATHGFDAETLARTLRTFALQFTLDLIVVDAPAGLRQESLLITSQADLVVVMLRPDTQDFHGTLGLLQALRHLGAPKIQLLANKAARRVDAQVMKQRFEQAFAAPVGGVLPLEEDVATLGSRKLFAATQPAHRFTRLLEHALDQSLSALPRPLVRRAEAATA